MTTPLLTVTDLCKTYPVSRGLLRRPGQMHALDHVSFEISRGEVVGLVGESGSGKTTVGRAVLRLIEPTSGRVVFDGEDVTAADADTLRRLRRKMQMVFQDPFGSLDPRRTVGAQIEVAFQIHGLFDRAGRRARAASLLSRVGLAARDLDRYPHEFSGGQRQRIGIARALALEPTLIVADEAVSALDVSVQAQVVNLLLDLRSELDLTILFISHDLSLVEYICDRVIVMYLGQIVETGTASDIYRNPIHPYTQALLSAIPSPDPDARHLTMSSGADDQRADRPIYPPLPLRDFGGGHWARAG